MLKYKKLKFNENIWQKLGVIMGDNCKTGIHTSLYPGVKINPGCMTLPGEIIKRDLTKNNF